MIGIINYGAGNLRSVFLAFERCGCDCSIVNDPAACSNLTGLVLPGVGSFSTASKSLFDAGWDVAIKQHLDHGKYLFGICLGMQLLFDVGTEDGHSLGLGLVSGSVELIETSDSSPLPHTGWNSVFWKKDHPVIHNIKTGLDFYHVHSYECIPESQSDVLATTFYGRDIVTAIATSQILGFQFHPEKSQPVGLALLSNFIDLCSQC